MNILRAAGVKLQWAIDWVCESAGNPVTVAEPTSLLKPTRVALSRSLLSTHRDFRPVGAIGPHYLELFKQVCTNAAKLTEIKLQLQTCCDRRHEIQTSMDQFDSYLQRAKKDTRLDYTGSIETWREAKIQIGGEKEALDQAWELLQDNSKDIQTALSQLWDKVYKYAQAYIDRCLDVNFGMSWALPHNGCVELRHLLDAHAHSGHRKKELLGKQLEIALSRPAGIVSDREQDRISREDGTEFLQTASRNTEQSSRSSTIAGLQDALEAAERFEQRIQAAFVEDFLLDLLQDAGEEQIISDRIASEDETLMDDETASRLENSSDHRNRQQELDDDPILGPEQDSPLEARGALDDALNSYYTIRGQLEEHQERYANALRDLRESEVQHMLTFSRTSLARFKRLADKSLSRLKENMNRVEMQFLTIRDRIIALGGVVPRTPEHSMRGAVIGGGLNDEHNHSQGSQRSVDRLGGEGRKRLRRSNNWRAQTKQGHDPLQRKSPPADLDVQRIGDYRSASLETLDRTPSTGRKRKLDEYTTRQDHLREELAKVPRKSD